MAWRDRIVINPDILVGKPIIKGTDAPGSSDTEVLERAQKENRINGLVRSFCSD